MSMPNIREVQPNDMDGWLEMRRRLWSGSVDDHMAEISSYFSQIEHDSTCITFVADDGEDGLVGFAEVRQRDYAEGCTTSPVAYLEGWWTAAHHRCSGLGRALIERVEQWAREQELSELASDTEVDNEVSERAHLACGFDEVERVICFRKSLE